ncbi:WHG domain [Corynebacterium epidermidicanis]|uniref:WHG domain n=2 Tax=Corynebacterium epidermidicanis TaxID=1050174 RepID=A0A0G3GQX2_9CORY|nr:WHG domain [Corynebacterium epidermidicanis]
MRTRAIFIFAAIHGFGCLTSQGVLRFLNHTAQEQLLFGLIEHVMVGIGDSLRTNITPTILPTLSSAASPTAGIPRASTMPRETPEQMRRALFRAAIEDVADRGVEQLQLESATRRAGLSLELARSVVARSVPFERQLESYLDKEMHVSVASFQALLPEHSSSISMGKATGVAFVCTALNDPAGFNVLTTIASGSIVPRTFEKSSEDFDIGPSFDFLLERVRAAIEKGGGPRTSWTLYENSLHLWCVAHGLAHAFSSGPLRKLDHDYKFVLLEQVPDMSITSLIRRLNLTPEA